MTDELVPERDLTPRQLEVLRCLEDQMDYAEIGAALKIKPLWAKKLVYQIAALLPNKRQMQPYRLATLYAIAQRYQRLHPSP